MARRAVQVPATEKGSPGRYRREKFKIMGPFAHWKLGAFFARMRFGAFPKPISYVYMYIPEIASGS